MKSTLKGLLKFLVTLLVLALIAEVIIYFCQGFIVYPGRSLYRGDSPQWQSRVAAMNARGFNSFDIEGAAGTRVKGICVPSPTGTAPAILWFHGRGENITEINPVLSVLGQTNSTVYLMQYRGYGHSAGETTEPNVLADAEALYDNVLERPDLMSRRIIVGGTEWGASVAFLLAARREVSSIIAVNPVPDMATAVRGTFRWAPWGLMLKDRYDVMPVLPSITVPVFLVRGSEDRLVSAEMIESMTSKIPARVTVHVRPGVGRDNVFTPEDRPLVEALTAFLNRAGK